MDRNKKNPNNGKNQGPPRGRVKTFLGLFRNEDNVLVLINPDPDSMACALAVKRLLWKHVQKTLIGYIGEIKRLENQAMMELLGIPMVRFNQIDIEYFNRRVLVDSQPHHHEIFGRFTYDAIIDHHPQVNNLSVPFLDIRPGFGATATILISYLRGAGIKPSMKLATALLYAIKTDTANFERDATEEDVKQFRYIYHYANMSLLRKIEFSELRINDLRYFRLALDRMIVTKKAIYTHIGEVDSADICVQIADFLMRVHGIGWTFVSGVYRGKLTVIIRNDGYRKDAGKVVTRAFSDLGPAGGHRGAARAEVPLDSLREIGVDPQDSTLQRFVRSRLDF